MNGVDWPKGWSRRQRQALSVAILVFGVAGWFGILWFAGEV